MATFVRSGKISTKLIILVALIVFSSTTVFAAISVYRVMNNAASHFAKLGATVETRRDYLQRYVEELGGDTVLVSSDAPINAALAGGGITWTDTQMVLDTVPTIESGILVRELAGEVTHGNEVISSRITACFSNYFEFAHLRQQRGRIITPMDRHGNEAVAVISESLADALFSNADPINQTIKCGAVSLRVVGVVSNANDSTIATTRNIASSYHVVYVPFPQIKALTTTDSSEGNSGAIGITQAVFKVNDFDMAKASADVIRKLLRDSRGSEGYSVFVPMEFLEATRKLGRKKWKDIVSIDCRDTAVRDADLAKLPSLQDLEVLVLDDCHITDAGLKHLESLGNLKVLLMRQTDVTDNGVSALQQKLPDCKIYW